MDFSNLVSAVIAVKKRRCWDMLDYNYADRLLSDDDTEMLLHIIKRNSLITDDESRYTYTYKEYNMIKGNRSMGGLSGTFRTFSVDDFVTAFFMQDSSFELTLRLTDLFTYPSYCTGVKNKKFFLKTTAMTENNPDTFTMKYGFIDSDNQKSKLHLPKLHFCLEVIRDGGDLSYLLPLSWCGKPTCDVTKTYWNWGYIKFHDKDMDELEMSAGCEAYSASNRYIRAFS